MPNYKINQKNDDELLIVEIIESGYDYNDFVLFYFSKDIANDKTLIEKIATKIDEYRKQDSVCIFGACKDSGESNDFSFIQNKFDLFFTNTTEQLFEDLINACYGTRSGMIHGDPSDWLTLKSQNCKHNILSKEGNSLSEIADSIICDIKNTFNIEETAQLQNIMCSIQSSEPASIPMNELQSFFNHISEFFPEATLLWNTYQKDCDNTKVVMVW